MTLTRIIAHYSECDNPEGGMWDIWTVSVYLPFSAQGYGVYTSIGN